MRKNLTKTPTGSTILDLLEEMSMSQAELAKKMNRPIKTINEIIKGKCRITENTALQLEKVLKISAQFLLYREADYRLFLARRKLNQKRGEK